MFLQTELVLSTKTFSSTVVAQGRSATNTSAIKLRRNSGVGLVHSVPVNRRRIWGGSWATQGQ